MRDYVRYRPTYPDGVVQTLVEEGALTPSSAIADVGSGTGISSELFLRHGYEVYGVEPNDDMRAAAESLLSAYPRFHSIAGRAEATRLPDSSADLVLAAQAFHWFDTVRAREEWVRILRPDGHAVVMWNSRRTGPAPFLCGYEALLQEHGTDYREVRRRNQDPSRLEALFDAGTHRTRTLANEQSLDLEGLTGRLLSSSYTPAADDPRRGPMLDALKRLFEAHNESGFVRLEYDTEIHIGRIAR